MGKSKGAPLPPGAVQISGCLSRHDSLVRWHETAQLYTRLQMPFRVAIRTYGQGWALWRVPAAHY